jgi:hypothetical protein
MPSLNLRTELFIAEHTICDIAKAMYLKPLKAKII